MTRQKCRCVMAAAVLGLWLGMLPRAEAGQAAAVATPAPAAAPAAARALVGRAAVGATLYKKAACFFCHSEEAQGGANGPRIGPDPIPYARFVQYVRNPRGEMPPFTSKVLADQDLADIYAFLQARTKPPALDTIKLLAP